MYRNFTDITCHELSLVFGLLQGPPKGVYCVVGVKRVNIINLH